MARRPTYPPLDVRLNGRLVGRLRKAAGGAIEFRYDPAWIGWENAIPVSSSLPLREERYSGPLVAAFFDNLLPDNDEIRARVAERAGARSADAYGLLGVIGRDCVGALQFLPEGTDPGPVGAVAGREVGEAEVAELLRNLASTPLGAGTDAEFRISIAGAQEKTALLRHGGRWLVPHGTTATTHILKPAIGLRRDGLDLSLGVENEYLCLRLAGALGLPAAEAEMATFEDQKVLVVERFDRFWTADGRLLRLPQEDLCQALGAPPTLKYESSGGPGVPQVMAHLAGSDDPVGDRGRFLRAQFVFWLLGATDGHAKNFSQFLAPAGGFRLTPLYDILSAQPNVDRGQIRRNQFKLAMAAGKTRHYVVGRIARRHFEEAAAVCDFSVAEAKRIFDEVADMAPGAIGRTLDRLPPSFPESLARSIADGVLGRLGAHAGAAATSDLPATPNGRSLPSGGPARDKPDLSAAPLGRSSRPERRPKGPASPVARRASGARVE